MWLDAEDVLFFASVLKLPDALLKRRDYRTPPEVEEASLRLTSFLARRADGHVDATMRPSPGAVSDAWEVDVNEAAKQLGVTADAVRKACRTGRFIGVAKKRCGRWMIPSAELETERSA